MAHLNGNSLLPDWQSAYCWFHSTETMVTKVSTEWQFIGGRCLFSASLIYQLALILWTATCCCNDLSVSLACVAQYLHRLLLPTSSTASYPAVTGLLTRWLDSSMPLCIMDRLLQHCSCWCTKDSHGQATACVERGCVRHYWHSELWKFDRGLGQILHVSLTSFTGLTSPTRCSSSWQ